jgi:hypothetical protein
MMYCDMIKLARVYMYVSYMYACMFTYIHTCIRTGINAYVYMYVYVHTIQTSVQVTKHTTHSNHEPHVEDSDVRAAYIDMHVCTSLHT